MSQLLVVGFSERCGRVLRRVVGGVSTCGNRRLPDPSDPSLVVVASAGEGDDGESCSSILHRAAAEVPRWDSGTAVVSRHSLRLPEREAAAVGRIVGEDGYRPRGDGGVVPDAGSSPVTGAGMVPVVFERVEFLDALHLAQERARMAGLAQRHGGGAVGWVALQPGADVVGGASG